jgi:hypothetical protein
MPVDFLTSERIRQYGRFAGDPSPAQLGKYFFLNNKDRNEVRTHRGAHNRFGYALQLCTVRALSGHVFIRPAGCAAAVSFQ